MFLWFMTGAFSVSDPGNQGRSGDHVQMPRRLGLVHRPDVLEAAPAIPRNRQAAEAALRDVYQGGKLH